MTEPGTSKTSNSPENSEDEFPDTEEDEEDDEESLALEEQDDDPEETAAELAALEAEQEMSTEELMKMYGGGETSAITLAPLSTSPLPAKRRRAPASKPADLSDEPQAKSSKPSVDEDVRPATASVESTQPISGHHDALPPERAVAEDTTNTVVVNGIAKEGDNETSSDGGAEIIRNRSDSLMTYLMNGTNFDGELDDADDADFVLKPRKKEVPVGHLHQVTVDDSPLTVEQRVNDRVDDEFAAPLWLPRVEEGQVIAYLASLYTNAECGGGAPLRSAVSAAKLFVTEMDARTRLTEEARQHRTLNGRVVQDNECMLYALMQVLRECTAHGITMQSSYVASSTEPVFVAHYTAVNARSEANRTRLDARIGQMPDMDLVHKSYSAYREYLTTEEVEARTFQYCQLPQLTPVGDIGISANCDERFGDNLPAHRPWLDANECDQFENSLVIFSKRWNLMHKFALPHRSVAELVCYYYHWKKSERHDMFLRSHQRLEKKGYILSPHTADQMEPFVEQLTNPTAESAAGVADVQFHHHHLYNPADVTTHHYGETATRLPHLDSETVDAVLQDTPE